MVDISCTVHFPHVPLLNLHEEGVCPFHLQLIHGPKDMQRGIKSIVSNLSQNKSRTMKTHLRTQTASPQLVKGDPEGSKPREASSMACCTWKQILVSSSRPSSGSGLLGSGSSAQQLE